MTARNISRRRDLLSGGGLLHVPVGQKTLDVASLNAIGATRRGDGVVVM